MARHFAFVCTAASGHLNPTLPIVTELVKRGHRVSYVIADKFAAAVEAAGATSVPVHDEPPSRQPAIRPGAAPGYGVEQMAGVIERYVLEARVSFASVLARFRSDRPDAVCFDVMSFTGRMLSGLLGVPGIMLVPNFAENERFSFFERRTRGMDLGHPAMLRALADLHDFAAGYDLPPPPNPMSGLPPASLNIVFIPREFQLAAETFDERFQFVGPSLGARVADEEWRPKSPGVPVLFISLGTMRRAPGFFRTCLDVFAGSRWQVAMAIGRRTDVTELGYIPDNVVVRPHFAQLSVLSHTDVFISHAGMNSVMESLYFGVPLVAVPHIQEQDENARRVEELRLGRRLSATSPECLRVVVDEVHADAEIHRNLARMSEVIRGCGGARAAAASIESHLGITRDGNL